MTEFLTQYLRHDFAWIAVVVPGLLSLGALAFLPPARLPRVLIAVAASLVISWVTQRWVGDGILIWPVTLFTIPIALYRQLSSPSIRRSLELGAVVAAWTWLVLFLVDIGGCLAEPQCSLQATGGGGFVDALVLSPAVALAASVVFWFDARYDTTRRAAALSGPAGPIQADLRANAPSRPS